MKTRPRLVCHCPAAYFGIVPIAFLSSDPLDWGSCQMEEEAQSARILITMKERHVFCIFMHACSRTMSLHSCFPWPCLFHRGFPVCTDPRPHRVWSHSWQCGALPSGKRHDHRLALQERRLLGKWCGCWKSQKVHGKNAQTSGVTDGIYKWIK